MGLVYQKFCTLWHVLLIFKTNYIDLYVQKRCNSIADALELRLSRTNPAI